MVQRPPARAVKEEIRALFFSGGTRHSKQICHVQNIFVIQKFYKE
jgi:hypothetical protein